ncbi:hypothetical protein [Sandaracinus amylolyticus]|uniref:Uncharacterized protein n=1 Tax=Sandaracinus amylolyticus TaxID=927083 RepID=A0A0F6W5H7_9BACT|nr:hypothetical protein [Sandaracinus amylolyticus]AKF07987.1 hypothetical protein DB32_005136 [Sandaracinus amylolyticus]
MTFGYVGYVWAILGCASVVLFLSAIGIGLYVIGKRAERRGPRTVVRSLSGRDDSSNPPSNATR